MNATQIREQHAAAGARYAAAVAEMKAAFIDLAATDQAIMNSNVFGTDVPTFQGSVDLDSLRHPVFAPNVTNEPNRSWSPHVNAAIGPKVAEWRRG